MPTNPQNTAAGEPEKIDPSHTNVKLGQHHPE
jgi:hypothetical protein